jgi:hypothetical protein
MVGRLAVERCPQCSYEGYCYDSVCQIWCCGRCHTTETTAKRRLRKAHSIRVGPTVEESRDASPVPAGDHKEAATTARRRVA